MSIIAIANNYLYADRKVLMSSANTPAYFTYNKKLIVNKEKTWAFMKCGYLPQMSVVEDIMRNCLLIISLQDDESKEMIVKAAKKELHRLCKPLIIDMTSVFIFAIKGRAFIVSKLITTNCEIQQLPITSDLWVEGSGMHQFLTDYLLGYPIDEIFSRVSNTVDSVSKEFDYVDFVNDLNPIVTSLSSI